MLISRLANKHSSSLQHSIVLFCCCVKMTLNANGEEIHAIPLNLSCVAVQHSLHLYTVNSELFRATNESTADMQLLAPACLLHCLTRSGVTVNLMQHIMETKGGTLLYGRDWKTLIFQHKWKAKCLEFLELAGGGGRSERPVEK